MASWARFGLARAVPANTKGAPRRLGMLGISRSPWACGAVLVSEALRSRQGAEVLQSWGLPAGDPWGCWLHWRTCWAVATRRVCGLAAPWPRPRAEVEVDGSTWVLSL